MTRPAATHVGPTPGVRLVLAIALLLAAACSDRETATPASTAQTPVAATEFRAELSMAELMAHVIDNAADGIWLNQGWVTNAEGTTELFPTDEAGWLRVENAALTLAESSNLLLLPGRPLDDDPAWVEYAHEMHATAIAAHDAAVARDKQAFFDAGGAIYVVCRDCHQRYIVGETN